MEMRTFIANHDHRSLLDLHRAAFKGLLTKSITGKPGYIYDDVLET